MTLLIIIAVILFSVWLSICYVITKYIAELVCKLTSPNRRVNKYFVFGLSFLIAGLSAYFVVFSTPAKNYKTAYIETNQNGYKVTVKGKRVFMAHDPVSAILRRTYEDSVSFFNTTPKWGYSE